MTPETIAIIAVGVGLGGLMLTLHQNSNKRIDTLERRFDSLERRFDSMEQRFDSHRQHVDSQIEAQRQHFDSQLEAQRQHFDSRIDVLQASVSDLQQRQSRLEGVMETILELLSRLPAGR